MTKPRGDAIAPFYAMEVLKAANRREAAGARIIHMELGEPGGGPPPQVLEAAAKALRDRPLGYTEALGIRPLREKIAASYWETNNISIDPDRVVVTTGSSGGFLLAFLAAFGDGAALGLAEPGYPAYRNIAAALGFRPIGIATGPATRFQPAPDLLDAVHAATPLAGLLVASPANPTGTMIARAGLAGLVAWCERAGVRLVSDEVYHGIAYGAPAVSAAALSDRAIVVNSFSKYFAMTGWRIGWMVLPPDLVRPVERLAQNLFIAAPSLAQYAALAAFDARGFLDAKVAGYARNRARLLAALPALGFGELAPADGAFYVYADVTNLTSDSAAFCRAMLEEAGVATTPGIDFDPHRGSQYLRFAFAGAEDGVAEAIQRLTEWRSRAG